MNKQEMFQMVKDLPFDTKKTVYNINGTKIYIFRPSVLSKRFKDYDKNKNFQIWLKEGEREFRPNHLRVLIDLNLRMRSQPELKKELLTAFDNIFYGKDPEEELKELSTKDFEHFLNHIMIIGYLAQLLIIEQEYNYHKESKYKPATLFLQGWIREFIDNSKEIDNLCMSVCKGQPPKVQYTCKENKKNKKYEEKRDPLWYINN